MPDNPLKAVVDAIAEEDNSIGGLLITRLRQSHKYGRNDGELQTANPDRITIPDGVDWFEASMVGEEIDILAPSAFAGRYTILTVSAATDPEYVTVEVLGGGAPGFTDEDPVQFRMATLKVETVFEFLDPATHVTDTAGQLWVGEQEDIVTYGAAQLAVGDMEFQQVGNPTTGAGYLTEDHRTETEVIEAAQAYSALDKLRRALLVDYATDDELDRVGRNLAVLRPRGINDATYRRLIKALAYMPRGTVYALELFLSAFFGPGVTGYTLDEIPFPIPGDAWMIYETPNDNNTVYILLPLLTPGSDFEGRTFLHGPPGKGTEAAPALEATTTTDGLTATVVHTPISVLEVKVDPVINELDMAVLPSADTPAWTFVGEGPAPPAEGTVFSIAPWGAPNEYLVHLPVTGTQNGGRYSLSTDAALRLEGISRFQHWSIDVNWQLGTSTTITGRPWHIRCRDGERAVLAEWHDTSVLIGGVTVTLPVGADAWTHIRLERRGDTVRLWWNHQLLATVAATAFGATASKDFSFGHFDQGAGAQDWTVNWDNVKVQVRPERNWWNVYNADGALSAGNDWIDDTTNNPFVAGDTSKRVRIYSTNPENEGLWLATFSSASRLLLDGVVRNGASVSTPDAGTPAESFVTLLDPWFVALDDGKTLTISGSGSGNDGDYPVTEVISPRQVKVDATGPGAFTTESSLDWKFSPAFVTESNVEYELIDAGSVAAKTLTWRQGITPTTENLEVWYTNVLSAQLLRNEFVVNQGSGGSAPDIYYPFYLLDVSSELRRLFDEITAAGVIPEYEREI